MGKTVGRHGIEVGQIKGEGLCVQTGSKMGLAGVKSGRKWAAKFDGALGRILLTGGRQRVNFDENRQKTQMSSR